MGYTVEYNPELSKRYPTPKNNSKSVPIAFIVSLIFIIVLYIVTRDNVVDLLIPGDPQVTKAAFSDMVDQIAAGESLKDSFFAFCENIISHRY